MTIPLLQTRHIPMKLDLLSRICYELEQTYHGKHYAEKLRQLWNHAEPHTTEGATVTNTPANKAEIDDIIDGLETATAALRDYLQAPSNDDVLGALSVRIADVHNKVVATAALRDYLEAPSNDDVLGALSVRIADVHNKAVGIERKVSAVDGRVSTLERDNIAGTVSGLEERVRVLEGQMDRIERQS